MGKTCCTTDCCGKKQYNTDIFGSKWKEIDVPNDELEPFQNRNLAFKELKDDQQKLLRIFGSPFIQIHVIKLFDQLKLLDKYVILQTF